MLQVDLVVGFLTNPFFLLSAAFWVGVLLLVILLGRLKKRKALSVFFPFLAMIKTTRLNKFLQRLARISPRAWRVVWTIGIFGSFAFTLFGFYYFFMNLMLLLVPSEAGPPPEARVTPLIPGLTINFETFIYLIIPILIVLTVHEVSHGISANVDGIPVKSTGILGMGLFFIVGFGAFVEIDEASYKRGNHTGWAKARLAGAGSFSNAILAAIALLCVINFSSVISLSWGEPDGLYIANVYGNEDGGYNAGVLFPGDILREINGTRIPAEMSLHEYLTTKVVQNDTLSCIITRDGTNITVPVATGPPPPGSLNMSIAFIGIQTETWWPPRDWFGQWLGGRFPNTLLVELFWLWIISINVTIFNMLPLPIFDGDKIVYELLDWIVKPRKERTSITDRFKVGKALKTLELDPPADRIETISCSVNGNTFPLEEQVDYQPVDSDADGVIDHLSFEIREKSLPPGSIVEMQYVAEVDVNKPVKTRVMNVIRLVALLLIVGNFFLSGIFFGFTL